MRKSLLEDRQGERYELLLLALSTFVLKRRIQETISHQREYSTEWEQAKGLVTTEVEWSREGQTKMQVWCLLCEYALSKQVRSRRAVREKTNSFVELLRHHETLVTQKEKALNPDIDFTKVVRESENEYSRWTKNWMGLQGEWFLQTLQGQLSSIPPKEFLSQSYEDAFSQQKPITQKKKASVVHASSVASQSTIATLQDKQIELQDDIARLEKELLVAAPQRNGTHTSVSGGTRSSLPPTPNKTPVKTPERARSRMSERNGLQFLRKEESPSVIARRSVSESPRAMSKVHGISSKGT